MGKPDGPMPEAFMMTDRLIGAIAIEDEEIQIATCKLRLNEPPSCSVTTSIPKPQEGYSVAFMSDAIERYFRYRDGNFHAIGISMFGVVDANNRRLVAVPSRDWSRSSVSICANLNLDILSLFSDQRWNNTEIYVRNDATAAALYESIKHPEGRINTGGVIAYIRAGSGINAGVTKRGRPLRQGLHPELGHLRPIRHSEDKILGCCEFHEVCFEGLATLNALFERSKRSLSELEREPEDGSWNIQAYYLAQACLMLTLTIAPDCIVIGGRAAPGFLFGRIRKYFDEFVGIYPRYTATHNLEEYIRPARVAGRASLKGALLLAQHHSEEAGVVSLQKHNTERRRHS